MKQYLQKCVLISNGLQVYIKHGYKTFIPQYLRTSLLYGNTVTKISFLTKQQTKL